MAPAILFSLHLSWFRMSWTLCQSTMAKTKTQEGRVFSFQAQSFTKTGEMAPCLKGMPFCSAATRVPTVSHTLPALFPCHGFESSDHPPGLLRCFSQGLSATARTPAPVSPPGCGSVKPGRRRSSARSRRGGGRTAGGSRASSRPATSGCASRGCEGRDNYLPSSLAGWKQVTSQVTCLPRTPHLCDCELWIYRGNSPGPQPPCRGGTSTSG